MEAHVLLEGFGKPPRDFANCVLRQTQASIQPPATSFEPSGFMDAHVLLEGFGKPARDFAVWTERQWENMALLKLSAEHSEEPIFLGGGFG
jgi:hypothetical protein